MESLRCLLGKMRNPRGIDGRARLEILSICCHRALSKPRRLVRESSHTHRVPKAAHTDCSAVQFYKGTISAPLFEEAEIVAPVLGFDKLGIVKRRPG
jgi:hypothetical protein